MEEVSHIETVEHASEKPYLIWFNQTVLQEWCKVNDSITPKFLSRQEWNQKIDQGILQPGAHNKKDLFIPEDVQLWELFPIIQAVDEDTYKNHPQKAEQKKSEREKLGKLFTNTSIYLASRIRTIPVSEGGLIAREITKEFYLYGNALRTGHYEDDNYPTLFQISDSKTLSAEELEEVDKWMAGSELYATQIKKATAFVDQNPGVSLDDAKEMLRQSTLKKFFRASQTALNLNHRELKKQRDMQPWQDETSTHQAFLQKVQRQITRSIKAPQTELETAIFQRGVTALAEEMLEPGKTEGIDMFLSHLDSLYRKEARKLAEAINLDHMKQELEQTKASADIPTIAAKEREIALKIQIAVAKFTGNYKSGAYQPATILKNQELNCVGFSILGGALLEEVGISYLGVSVPQHSITFLLTSDNKVYWQDMQTIAYNHEITDDKIDGRKRNGTKITAQDIVNLKDNPQDTLFFFLKSNKIESGLTWIQADEVTTVEVGNPNTRLKSQVMQWLALELKSQGRTQETIKVLEDNLQENPNYITSQFTYARILKEEGEYSKAIQEYQRLIRQNPFHITAYTELAVVYDRYGQTEKGYAVAQEAVALGANSTMAFSTEGYLATKLKKWEEAENSYTKAILANPPNKDKVAAVNYTNRAITRERQKKYTNAIEDLNKALILDGTYNLARKVTAEIYETTGNTAEALENYTEYLKHLDETQEEERRFIHGKIEKLKGN